MGLPSGAALELEWDLGKAAANRAKHGVAFEEASTAFADPLSSSVPDPRHSHGEARFAILGRSARGRLRAVFYTERGAHTGSSTHAKPPAASGAPMSTGPSERPAGPDVADVDPDELLPEYDFRGGERGKYAARYAEGTNVVVLDPDVAAVYPTAEAVNSALRTLAEVARREVARRQAGRAAA